MDFLTVCPICIGTKYLNVPPINPKHHIFSPKRLSFTATTQNTHILGYMYKSSSLVRKGGLFRSYESPGIK